MSLDLSRLPWLLNVTSICRNAIKVLNASILIQSGSVILFNIDGVILDTKKQIIHPVFVLFQVAIMLGIFPVFITSRYNTNEIVQKTMDEISGAYNISFSPTIYFRNCDNIEEHIRLSMENLKNNGYTIVMSVYSNNLYFNSGYQVIIPVN